jgi:hypothetical protein
MTVANKVLVHEYLESVWNGRDVEALDDFYPSPYLSEQESSAEQELPSLEDAKEYIRHVQAAFPDLRVVIDDIIAEEDKVVQLSYQVVQFPLYWGLRWTCSQTATKEIPDTAVESDAP